MATLVLIDLNSQASFEFQYFPDEVQTRLHPNWRPQDVTIGIKPLLYENSDPELLTFPELWMDESYTNESLTETLQSLKEFAAAEVEDRGAPPPLLATWGDRKQLCVLQDLTIAETFFSDNGEPIRARLSMELIQIQDEGEAVGVNIT